MQRLLLATRERLVCAISNVNWQPFVVRQRENVMEKPKFASKTHSNSLEQYLGTPRYNNGPPLVKIQIGVAMGLAVTEKGGILLPVEVVTMVGKGELITGQLGEVMRESAYAALSYIRSRAKELKIDPNFQETTDLHIHLPENALPKDGPSAGITIATALVSALTRRPVRSNLAMTGELTLLGSVLAIGGLREKVLAAQQANITTLIIPAENNKDLSEIPAKIRQRIQFISVHNMDQVIEYALLDAPPPAKEEQDPGEQGATEPRPLRLGEHVPVLHEQNLRRTSMPADEEGEHETEEHDPPAFMIPSPDPVTHDVYPRVRAGSGDDNVG